MDRAFARALSRRYFVRSTPVNEKPRSAKAIENLPMPQPRSRADLPSSFVSVNALSTTSEARAIRVSAKTSENVSRQKSSSSNHSCARFCLLMVPGILERTAERCQELVHTPKTFCENDCL